MEHWGAAVSYRFRPFNGAPDWQWIRARVSLLRVEDTRGIMAEDSTGKLCGAAIFDNFIYSSAQVALVLETPILIRAGFLDLAYSFLFEQCGRRYCYAMVAENNTRSRRLSERVGFEEKMRIPSGYLEGVDLIVYELARERYYKARADHRQRAA